MKMLFKRYLVAVLTSKSSRIFLSPKTYENEIHRFISLLRPLTKCDCRSKFAETQEVIGPNRKSCRTFGFQAFTGVQINSDTWRSKLQRSTSVILYRKEFYSKDAKNLESAIKVKFIRSSGPGGQNVNKLNTKAEVRLDITRADWLPTEVREKLMEQEKNRINKNGELIVTSESFRSQSRNLQDAINKIQQLISTASYVPEGPSQETIDKILESVKRENEKRLETKKYRTERKRDRIV
eukprot:Seg1143.4 transcript_id=Seg1143.4/GoldUCD/mRNA.D3Y31 product="Peptidyl-tRNA hydrolase ICT1 mitochondrial" protein_id=Seg1143.4/GoldUCD/D3Y31